MVPRELFRQVGASADVGADFGFDGVLLFFQQLNQVVDEDGELLRVFVGGDLVAEME